jgi:hypothetical protein
MEKARKDFLLKNNDYKEKL